MLRHVLPALLLVGCMSTDVQQHAALGADRSIIVPVGQLYLLGPLKSELRRAGWRTTTNVDAEAAYRLEVSQGRINACPTGGHMVRFDVVIVDNRSGDEVLSMSGRDCTPNVADRFAQLIRS